MRRVERVGDLAAMRRLCVEEQLVAREALRERLALEQLHDEIVGVALAPDVEQRADVRVRERGGGLGFALEALAGVGTARTRSDGRTLIATVRSSRVSRALVDLTHAAGAQRPRR